MGQTFCTPLERSKEEPKHSITHLSALPPYPPSGSEFKEKHSGRAGKEFILSSDYPFFEDIHYPYFDDSESAFTVVGGMGIRDRLAEIMFRVDVDIRQALSLQAQRSYTISQADCAYIQTFPGDGERVKFETIPGTTRDQVMILTITCGRWEKDTNSRPLQLGPPRSSKFRSMVRQVLPTEWSDLGMGGSFSNFVKIRQNYVTS